MRVGFVGLGRMGRPMACNLARAGFDMLLWTRDGAKAQALARKLGCAAADTPRALSDGCDVVVTMLADDTASASVHGGAQGLFAGSARLYLEMGTLSPQHIADLCAQAPAGTLIVDAPVSGATQAARDAALVIMAGCTEEHAAHMAPVLDAMGRQTLYLGRSGAGAVMKLAVNSLLHSLNQALAEAMTLAEAAGIARERAFDVIEASAACAPMLKYRRPLYLDEAAHDVTFTVALARKDMAVTVALSEALGTRMPQGAVTLETLKQAEAQGFAARDMAAMLAWNQEDRT